MPSDPLTYTCTCSASLPLDDPSHEPGVVLLFYRYFTSPPALPPPYSAVTSPTTSDPTIQYTLQSLHDFQKSTCETLALTGKLRIAKEGFNITVAGSTSSINRYITACVSHWSFAGLSLSPEDTEGVKNFFKPTPGCACVFSHLNIRITDEITPLGLTNYSPQNWDSVVYLSPEEFHNAIIASNSEDGEEGGENQTLLLDIRNHYESRIGYFSPSPNTQIPTIKPQIRRFSQFPAFVKKHMMDAAPKTIYSYCTGGIRCEKATRWIAEQKPADQIYTLKGGIAAYMAWFEGEVKGGRRRKEECLWRGREYVFDARGSLGLGLGVEDGMEGSEKVAMCHGCGKAEDRLGKCMMEGCELVLVVCEECNDVKCCEDCGEMNEKGKRGICSCERERELRLWGPEGMKSVQVKTPKKGRKNRSNVDNIDIKISKIIC
ncbi:Rhodanese domain protein [Rutstroemia sp. NJR-2017a BVV2]|nr:Rhodanese domain protein [Rutstroemia sp. NJR-2017a BVV2]